MLAFGELLLLYLICHKGSKSCSVCTAVPAVPAYEAALLVCLLLAIIRGMILFRGGEGRIHWLILLVAYFHDFAKTPYLLSRL